MKKNLIVLIAAVLVFSLMAFSYLKSNNNSKELTTPCAEPNNEVMYDFLKHSAIMNPDELVYKIDTRFIAKIAKSDLDNASTIIDILPKDATDGIGNYQSSRISLLDDFVETDIRAYAENEFLTDSQIQLVKSTDETDNIYIRSDYTIKNSATGQVTNKYLTYFISIVPDQEALYEAEAKPLIQYLKEGSKDVVSTIQKDELKPGRVRFTITKEGTVSGVKLTATSGYESVDNVLVKLIENMPGKWTPASNSDGLLVDQDLVFFFGLDGC